MNPISAIRPFVPPTVTAMPNEITRSTSGKGIPTAELQELASVSLAPPATGPQSAGGFSDVLTNLVGEVNQKQGAAGRTVAGLLGGENVSLHQAMVAMEEASISFQLMVEVRNKLLESYQEIMRMQV
jgi:flagellar hook-basal body complex protein FliE